VTTTTISKEQHAMASQRIQEAGLQDRVTLLMTDYRDLAGQYDKLVSVEMIEAVGDEYLPTYFSTCDRLLKPGGKMLIQAITMPDQRYATYLKSVDFIQKYIFPGGCLPSVGAMQAAVSKGTGLRLTGLFDFAESYAITLRNWRERFFQRITEVRELGFDDRFIRMWEYYLCYCEGAFRERAVGVSHLVWDKVKY
jgi:cyclopropane-fatty-acyl-phospholipid synthase